MSVLHKGFDIQSYMTRGVTRVVLRSLVATARNPKEAAYMRSFASSAAAASGKRKAAKKEGEHIPPFLIASITSRCNLHCAGCYSRANHACEDGADKGFLTAEEWDRIFTEAQSLGISFILLAGGEPLLRADVLKRAATHPEILFPIFTNGTYLTDSYLSQFDEHRNLLPVISIEGGRDTTDRRRGDGVYQKVTDAMQSLHARGIAFGASVTVTRENLTEVCADDFVDGLYRRGCKAIIYVEYVPADDLSEALAPQESDRAWMKARLRTLRRKKRGMVFISFPGDEKSSGGCVAAGRGFFHINAGGGAEPCPFSPYSDCNVRDTSIREALHSELFYALNTEGLLKDDHVGGCTLYANREKVEQIIASQADRNTTENRAPESPDAV